jgi:hypothetical protein
MLHGRSRDDNPRNYVERRGSPEQLRWATALTVEAGVVPFGARQSFSPARLLEVPICA